jgi:hypothetical protein
MMFTFSRGAARVLAVLLIVIETWRRRHQLGNPSYWPVIFDDYLAGAFLIISARMAAPPTTARGQRFLATAWGVATGMMYGSFFGQLENRAAADPSGAPVTAILILKAVGLLLCLVGLVGALREITPRSESRSPRAGERPAPPPA